MVKRRAGRGNEDRTAIDAEWADATAPTSVDRTPEARGLGTLVAQQRKREDDFWTTKGDQVEASGDGILDITAAQIEMFENTRLAGVRGTDTALIKMGLHEPLGSTVSATPFGKRDKGPTGMGN